MKILAALFLLGSFPAVARADDPPKPTVRFDRVMIDDAFPDAYQVEVVDVDGDKKPDIVALGGATIAWYQNPTWIKRVIATGGTPLAGDIISSSTVDLDGDGKSEVAIACDFAMNTPTRGKLFLASQGETFDAPWIFRHITDVPSIHRVRWIRWGNSIGYGRRGQPELVVASLFGPESQPPDFQQDQARVSSYSLYTKDPKRGPWLEHVLGEFAVLHAISIDEPGPKQALEIAGRGLNVASNEGVTRFVWSNPRNHGNQGLSRSQIGSGLIVGGRTAKRGSSEVHRGWIANEEYPFWATIDPWHGSEVAVNRHNDKPRNRNPLYGGMGGLGMSLERTVIDNTLDDGHALWVADVDGDGTDEIFAGHRGKDHRVAMYQFDGKAWNRTVLDNGVAAQDLRGGDIDSDGVPDVVAVGGKTHNVVWYRPIRVKP